MSPAVLWIFFFATQAALPPEPDSFGLVAISDVTLAVCAVSDATLAAVSVSDLTLASVAVSDAEAT